MSLYDSGVRKVIDDHLLELSKEKRDYGDFWSASSAGYCMRKNIFNRLGVPEVEPDPRRQRVFTSGHIFHEWIQKLTKDTGISVAQEERLEDDTLMVRGHYDDLIKSGDDIILYDYKTVHSRSFNYKGDEPGHFHRLQVGTYMYMLRKDNYPELTEARILLISKDDLRMKEQRVLWTADLGKDVYTYWATLNGYWSKKTIPKCTCADFDGGFMADKKYNPYYYDGEPCSLAWYEKAKKEGALNASK